MIWSKIRRVWNWTFRNLQNVANLFPVYRARFSPVSSEDGVIISFFSSNTYHVSRPSLCKNTFHRICSNDYCDVHVPWLREVSLTKEKSIVYSLHTILRPQRQRAVEKFEKVFKILASLRISYSTSSSFSRRNLCLSGDGSSVATVAVYRVRLRRRRVSWYSAVPDRLRVPPASWWVRASVALLTAAIGSASSDRPPPRQAAAEAHPLASRILRSVQQTLHADLESVWLEQGLTQYRDKRTR